MITAITVLNHKRCQPLLEEMFRLRARVFGDRLGWNVEIQNGQERDRFDDLDPAYVVGLDGEGRMVSSARLLQTSGRHMLEDVYSDIMGREPPLRSPTIWEATRFCVDSVRLGGGERVMRAYCELAAGVIAFARKSGGDDILAVGDPVLTRALRRAEASNLATLGQRMPMGESSLLASVIDCTPHRIALLRAHAGLQGPALTDDQEVLAAFTPTPAKAEEKVVMFRAREVGPRVSRRPQTAREIVDYCLGQIQTARAPKERLTALVALDKLLGAENGGDLLDEMGPLLAPPEDSPSFAMA